MPGPVWTWGSTAGERAEPFPCDRYLPEADFVAFRAVDVDARAELVFRWLCQLRVAPYSYDWIDNLGRRSPRALTPGLEDLEDGQRFMTIFRLAEHEPGRSITLRHSGLVFGRFAVTYRVAPRGPERSRLVVKLLAQLPRSPMRPALRQLLAAGDLVMMRRQLLNLKGLAERSALGPGARMSGEPGLALGADDRREVAEGDVDVH